MKKIDNKPQAAAPIEIGSLDQLQKLVDTPITCDFELNGKLVRLNLKPVTPGLAEQLHALQRKVSPPWIEGRKEYNLTDIKYLEAKAEATKKARSMVVYSCCPAIASSKPGLTSVDQIHAFVQTILTENILEIIEAKAVMGGINLQVRANFTSTPGLES